MPDQFLYQQLDAVSRMRLLSREMPKCIIGNLNPKFALRPYQVEALARFIYCYNNDFSGKPSPLHLLFNLATGSGKTLLMAGLILYLYENGMRNFLFFVNSTNIVEKTKENFLNALSAKYLFAQPVTIEGRRVSVNAVDNFAGANPNDINICFTTIQQLHLDLTATREESITFEDFKRLKVVLIADEAHHLNRETKSDQELFDSWENTVEQLLNQNRSNVLLEFTATLDYADESVVTKYVSRVIMRYDLLEFRNDGYSKDVVIVQSDFDLGERILQAIVLSYYKQTVAAKHKLHLKPVILFKAQRTIAQSESIRQAFLELIEKLTPRKIEKLQKSNIPLIRKAFETFERDGVTHSELIERLKLEFRPEVCVSVNDESEKERNQLLLNSLEDRDNRIRVIFAVQKLNEGWDVLNLFDIVRCYEGRDAKAGRPGKTTVSEAQLIGRGARYFPFSFDSGHQKDRRKYDEDLENELRVLEELHYHTINDNRYISELRTALIEKGLIDDSVVEKRMRLKDDFKGTQFYKEGYVFQNVRRKKNYGSIKKISDLGIHKSNYRHIVATGKGGTSSILGREAGPSITVGQDQLDVRVSEIERNIVESAIARIPFYTYQSLNRVFPNLRSIGEFVTSKDYLGDLEITFQGDLALAQSDKVERLAAVLGLLSQLEAEIRSAIVEFEGSREFVGVKIRDVFYDKTLKFEKHNPRVADDPEFQEFISSRQWHVFDSLYATSEEKPFVKMIDRQMEKLNASFESVYLIRNEGHLRIFNFRDGRPFEPDFLLFLTGKSGKVITYQMFIEPKGRHLKGYDEWKEKFLIDLTKEYAGKVLTVTRGGDYRLIGVPFYNTEDENEFKASLWESIAS